ncbi:MAG: Fic family protein, partial [Myxococcaceae bacterium]
MASVQTRKRIEVTNGLTQTTFPSNQGPGSELHEQIEFALKYDGVDLEVWSALFALPGANELAAEIEAWVRRKPSSQYARRAWFLCEFVSKVRLALPDAAGNYVPLLDPGEYYTTRPRNSRRHRVADNLLGDARFCPMVRRTAALQALTDGHLESEAAKVVAQYDADVLRRAVNYLYTKETRSSFKLEGEAPDAQRAARFVEVLSHTGDWQELDESTLTRLQNLIVLSGAEDASYRKEEVYVGEQLDLTRQLIHYVAPRAVDLSDLMNGLTASVERMASSEVPAVVQAAAAAFGFVFLHPFTDGNGRLHRLLIHRVLTRA